MGIGNEVRDSTKLLANMVRREDIPTMRTDDVLEVERLILRDGRNTQGYDEENEHNGQTPRWSMVLLYATPSPVSPLPTHVATSTGILFLALVSVIFFWVWVFRR